jgi:ankyrin repeat protein
MEVGARRVIPGLHRGAVLLALVAVGWGSSAGAHEVDHFTLPVGRVYADLGPFLTQDFYERIARAVAKTNRDIDRCLAAGGNPAELGRLHSTAHMARAVCGEFPSFVSYIQDLERLFHSAEMKRRYPGLVVAHRPVPCIYDRAHFPLDPRQFYLLWRSSTIMVNGLYLGTDKIGHFVHNGINYFDGYQQVIDRGGSPEAARQAAIALGAGDHFYFSEYRLLGKLTSSVVSNGDLAANYLGLLFYLNLTQEIRLRGQPSPPMLVLEDERWTISPHVRPDSDFLARFFSEHFDEALNPNLYEPYFSAQVRSAIQPRCRNMRAWYVDVHGEPLPPSYLARMFVELQTYHGDYYGHTGVVDGLVGAYNTCACAPPRAAEDEDLVLLLHEAVAAGDLTALGSVLRQGVDVDATSAAAHTPSACRGQTALHVAATSRAGIVALLLEYGANPNACTVRGVTPLHKAAAQPAILAMLLEAGADIEHADDLGRTPLHWAVQSRAAESVAVFLGAGAAVDVGSIDGETPLHVAARVGAADIAAGLVLRGAAPDARAAYGVTPLHIAARQGHVQVVVALLEAGAVVGCADEFGCTALHDAAARGDVRIVTLLCGVGADPNAADAYRSTPLHQAARAGHLAVVEQLLAAGAGVEARNAAGLTAHAVAVRARRLVVAERLHAAGNSRRMTYRDVSGQVQVPQALLAAPVEARTGR